MIVSEKTALTAQIEGRQFYFCNQCLNTYANPEKELSKLKKRMYIAASGANQELEAEQAEKIAGLEEEIQRNMKTVDHAMAMVEAVMGAIAAKSEAAKFSLNL
jgi:YHS domain-containing protein